MDSTSLNLDPSLDHRLFSSSASLSLFLIVVECLSDCSSDFFTDWSTPGSVLVFPRQAVLLTRSTDDSLRVLIHTVGTLHQRKVMLRLYVSPTDLNCVQFIASNTPVKKFLTSRFTVKRPRATGLHDRYSKGPVVVTNL